MRPLGILIIGTGKIALANHIPGIALSGKAKLVALCDSDPAALESAARETGIIKTYQDFNEAIVDPQVDAVVIATPNIVHPPAVLACAAAKKHVLCEKPLALDGGTAKKMLDACVKADIRHMTAFTYRFVPAMRYTEHLIKSGAIGRPIHFRAQRFQDWSDRNLGWRQVQRLAGTGELGDMLSHRIDYAHMMIGPMKRLVAGLRQFIPTRGGQPADVDDWAAMIVDFDADVTGVLESTKLATGRGEGYGGRDDVEVNGTEGTIVASTQSPLEVRIGRKGGSDLEKVKLPEEFQKIPGSPRDPRQGDPRVTFRYDQSIEFIDAIVEGRDCRPSLREGVNAQAVMDSAVVSHREKRWVDVSYPLSKTGTGPG
ncbi:MAG TPA: Gfo/Idh/MocA family oxidoreductase [Tepidisphaeraceae bacterium]|jgi:predicted dehydrogenase